MGKKKVSRKEGTGNCKGKFFQLEEKVDEKKKIKNPPNDDGAARSPPRGTVLQIRKLLNFQHGLP
jgi:hypothetical protein